MPFSCYTIGGNSLLIACTEMLLERGHNVLGVVTNATNVAQWASGHGLEVIDADDDYSRHLHESSFDYFLSIAHLAIVPGSVLEIPQRGAINFHDGLLPRFAGLNVPVWALINGEAEHGVTWHVMTKHTDAGDILVQSRFAIDPSDTALTLNTKCFDAGLKTFDTLVNQLESGTEQRQPQDIANRHYFSRSDRPAAACFLDWRRSAAQLNATVRATQFGKYPNPIGAAKIVASGRVFVVSASRIVERPSGCSLVDEVRSTEQDGSTGQVASTGAAPGTVLAVSDEHVLVATGQNALSIRGLAMLDGTPLSVQEFREWTRLRPGDQFETLTDAEQDRLTSRNRLLAKAEPFWLKRLADLQPVSVASQLQDVTGSRPFVRDSVSIAIPPSFRDQWHDSFRESVSAAFVAYLSVAHQITRVDLAVEDTSSEQRHEGDDRWLSRRLPMMCRVDHSQTFTHLLHAWRQERDHSTRAGRSVGWLRDLIGRTPALREKPELRGAVLDMTGVWFVDSYEDGTNEDDPTTSIASSPTLVVARSDDECKLTFGSGRFARSEMEDIAHRFSVFLARIASCPDEPLTSLNVLTRDEWKRQLVDWNQTASAVPRETCVHELIERQVERTPASEAIVLDGEALTYQQMNARANQLARHLRQLGIGPEDLVGVCIERSLDMVVAILAVQKAGAAYVPLDPAFPQSRIALMLDDSCVPIVITQSHLVAQLPPTSATIVRIDSDWDKISAQSPEDLKVKVASHHLAYVIYTSGSTGRPKGVMVEHRNVVNFFVGMDQRVAVDADGDNVLIAVTSLSFDISVLELLWTLARGFKIVLYSERHASHRQSSGDVRSVEVGMVDVSPVEVSPEPMRFGLFYFASDEDERSDDKYRLLIEGARFADAHGFVSISTPERHFHAFGGLYPNPAVAAAGIATITKNLQIRAGSVVLPLHHPIRIAEDWALVDNLSNGRVGVAFASGWQPVDFVIRPETYHDRHRVFREGIETVRKLWRGEGVEFPDADGQPQTIRTLPRPVQNELPVWVTTAGSSETWRQAGEMGANVLTHLLGQSVDELAEKIQLYRNTYQSAGHAGSGSVTLMLHTFLGDDTDDVREIVRKPLTDYLASALSLVKDVASTWAAFKRKADGTVADIPNDLSGLTREEMDDLLAFSFERYYSTSGLFGTPEQSVESVRRLRSVGVDEIACLIDFGIDSETVLGHLGHLNRLRELCEEDVRMPIRENSPDISPDIPPDAVPVTGGETIGALIRRHGVTHLQCTPSMASMIVADEESASSLRDLTTLMIGGEAFPPSLARELRSFTDARIINMYGPTETTIWSSTHDVEGDGSSIPIGRPIANTQMYLLDDRRQPKPVGAIGELYIGGEGVARGYLGQPRMTADRFVDNPFLDHSETDGGRHGRHGRRMYRTGDLARYQSDGTLEFVGRVDHQVKLRGYRIELGEIEVAMTKHVDIREAIVVVREDTPGDRRLVGYYVGDPKQPIDASDLRSFLRDLLPGYMVPSRFAALAQFPQTPNRKIDRSALPSPEQATPVEASEPLKPASNEYEAKIAEIWREVLGIDHAGRHDNFFDIGGHSLLAVKTLRLMRSAFTRELAITDLFRFPTVSSLAAYLSDDAGNESLADSQQRGATRREQIAARRHRPRG